MDVRNVEGFLKSMAGDFHIEKVVSRSKSGRMIWSQPGGYQMKGHSRYRSQQEPILLMPVTSARG